MGLIQEFKAFAMRGNVIDLAVGVVIGGAFTKVVTSVVENIIMPIVKFFNETATSAANIGSEAPKLTFPAFGFIPLVQTIFDFIITAFALFLIVKLLNAFQKKTPAPAPPATPEDVLLLREIRDSLAKNAPRRAES